MCKKLLNQSEARVWWEFSGAWPKAIQAWESHKDFTHQILAQSNQQFVCKCAAQPIGFGDYTDLL